MTTGILKFINKKRFALVSLPTLVFILCTNSNLSAQRLRYARFARRFIRNVKPVLFESKFLHGSRDEWEMKVLTPLTKSVKSLLGKGKLPKIYYGIGATKPENWQRPRNTVCALLLTCKAEKKYEARRFQKGSRIQ